MRTPDSGADVEVYAFRGEPIEALKWLDQAYLQKDSGMLPLIKSDTVFRRIEGDPGYRAFLKKMNLFALLV